MRGRHLKVPVVTRKEHFYTEKNDTNYLVFNEKLHK